MGNGRWKGETLDPSLSRFPLRKPEFVRSGGEQLGHIYGPDDPPEDVGYTFNE